MAANDLRAQRAVDIGQVEGARFGRQLGMEDDLKVEVAELLGEVGRGAALDGIDRLVGFLEEKGPEGLDGPGVDPTRSHPGPGGER